MNTESNRELLDIAKQYLTLTTGELDPYTSEKGRIINGQSSVTLLTPAHIQFAKYGRGPGKNPPFEAIFDFVEKNNIQFEGKDKEGTAQAIQFSIGKKGTSNFVPNAPNALEEALAVNYKEFQQKMAKSAMITINNQMIDFYKKIQSEKDFMI